VRDGAHSTTACPIVPIRARGRVGRSHHYLCLLPTVRGERRRYCVGMRATLRSAALPARPLLAVAAEAGGPPMSRSTADWASRYISKYGLALVPIPPGHKAPLHQGWTQRGGYVTDIGEAQQRWGDLLDHGIGAVLGPSRLCSIHVDTPEHAEPVLGELGIDLGALREATPTIQGNPSRYRLMFQAPPGVALGRKTLVWPARQPGEKPPTLFEFRAANVQDVLPPTTHPGTGKPYVWLTPPNTEFPLLPEALLELWQHWNSHRKELEAMCPWGKHGFNPESAPRGDGAGPNVIAAFNQVHPIEGLLEAHGYTRRGKRWISPTSSSGLAGVTILDGRVYSHHAGDPLADDHAHDAFDLFRILDHGGDTRSAIKAAAEELGMDSAANSKARWDGAAPGGARACEEVSMAGEDSRARSLFSPRKRGMGSSRRSWSWAHGTARLIRRRFS
jgi:putative DNA primase/helicase